MKNKKLPPTSQQLLAHIQPDLAAEMSPLACLLEPFTVRGLASTEQVAHLSGIEYKRANEQLNTLCSSSFERPAALHTVAARLEGQTGRPTKIYLLTDEGAEVLQALYNCANLKAPRLEDAVELAAAFAAMEVYTKARLAGYPAQVEQPLYFGGGKNNVRADVVIDSGDRQIIFEIEQASNQGTLPRVVDKLARMHNFFLSQPAGGQIDRQVRILFNLPQNDTRTIPVWQQALRDVLSESGGELSFELHTRRLHEFLQQPDWQGLQGFDRLQAAATPPVTTQPAAQDDLLSAHTGAQVDELRAVMRARQRVYLERLRQVQNQSDHALRVQSFFDIMVLIYSASHYRGSPVSQYGALPGESLEMLKSYLHDQQNARMLQDLQVIMSWVHTHNTGIMSMRNGFTTLIWEGFLFHHGFGRSGSLRVDVRLPDVGEPRSDIYVDVSIGREMLMMSQSIIHIGLRDKKLEEIALAWVLEAMMHYPQMLGLGEKPWLAKRSKSRPRKG